MSATLSEKIYPTRFTREELATTVVVRRIWRGSTPFRWEIYKGEMAEPIHVSASGFRNMEEAFRAGQAMLKQLELSRRSVARMPEQHHWCGIQIDGIATSL